MSSWHLPSISDGRAGPALGRLSRPWAGLLRLRDPGWECCGPICPYYSLPCWQTHRDEGVGGRERKKDSEREREKTSTFIHPQHLINLSPKKTKKINIIWWIHLIPKKRITNSFFRDKENDDYDYRRIEPSWLPFQHIWQQVVCERWCNGFSSQRFNITLQLRALRPHRRRLAKAFHLEMKSEESASTLGGDGRIPRHINRI